VALDFLHDLTVTTSDECAFELIEFLIGLDDPWTVPASSDGTTYNASGDQITHSGSGAGGFGNPFAWRIVQEPAGKYALCFQRGATAHELRVKFCPEDWDNPGSLYDAGSPSATQCPTGAYDRTFFGDTNDVPTDAAPVFGTISEADIDQLHVGAYRSDNTTGQVKYGFWCSGYSTLQARPSFCILVDPIVEAPYVNQPIHEAAYVAVTAGGVGVGFDAGLTSVAVADGAIFIWAQYAPGGVREWVTLIASSPSASDGIGSLGVQGVCYGRPESAIPPPRGVFGQATLLRARGGNYPGRQTLTIGPEVRKYVVFGNAAFPWDGSVLGTETTGAEAYPVAAASGASSDPDPPIVTLVSPANGSAIGRRDALVVEYTDAADTPRLAIATVLLGNKEDVVCRSRNGAAPVFRDPYTESVATPITNGYRLEVTRAGGWPVAPSLDVEIVDRSGNLAE
jgi:hypothetical protein